MEARAYIKGVFVTPRKARLLVDLVRNASVSEALAITRTSNKSVAKVLYKLIHSAEANATNNFKMNGDKLYIKEIMVGDGYRFKKLNTRAKGAGDSVIKRTCNIYIVIGERG